MFRFVLSTLTNAALPLGVGMLLCDIVIRFNESVCPLNVISSTLFIIIIDKTAKAHNEWR